MDGKGGKCGQGSRESAVSLEEEQWSGPGRKRRMVMGVRLPKADGRTGERWGGLWLKAWRTVRPLLEAPPEKGYGEWNSMEEIDILLSPAKASQELSVSV